MQGREKFRSWIPHGFDYYNIERSGQLLDLKDKIRALFVRAGYSEIIPPTFDYKNTFKIITRELNGDQTFVARDGDGENLAVRSDLTVQVIKAAANGRFHNTFPQRLSYIQPVFHDYKWGSGHNREVIQAGVELLGDDSKEGLKELLSLAKAALKKIGYEPRILYGDVRFLNRLFDRVPAGIRASLSESFHNKDTTRVESICSAHNVSKKLTRILIEVPLIFGDHKALNKLLELCEGETELLEILEEARQHNDVIYDFSLVRELSYYTGPVFVAYVQQLNEKVLSGGVYDNLFREFGEQHKNASGFAINLSLFV